MVENNGETIMKKITCLLVFLLQIPNLANASCNKPEALDWLIGDWLKPSKNGAIVERWRKRDISGGSGVGFSGIEYSGVGYSLGSDNKKVINETLRIVDMGGEIFLIAKPNQNPVPVAFKLVECNQNEAKFENKQHDFPQKLEYLREGNKLKVNVSADKQTGFSLEYVRQSSSEVNIQDRLSLVEEYIQAFNDRELEKMLSLVTEDIHWMSIMGTKTSVETETKQALGEALKNYFVQVPSVQSKWIKSNALGDWVFGIEQVSWLSRKKGASKSDKQTLKVQCSLSVYQFDGQLIKSVWYYPSQDC